MSEAALNTLGERKRRKTLRIGGTVILALLVGLHVLLIQRSIERVEETDKAFGRLFQAQTQILRLQSQFEGQSIAEMRRDIGSQIINGYRDLGAFLETAMRLAREDSMELHYQLLPLEQPTEAPETVFLLPIQFEFSSRAPSLASYLAFTEALVKACPVPASLTGYRSRGDGRKLLKTEIRLELWIRIPT